MNEQFSIEDINKAIERLIKKLEQPIEVQIDNFIKIQSELCRLDIGEEKQMTNREWLNSLTNEELANWLCDAMYDENLSKTLRTDVYTGISQIKFAYTDSRLGLKQWLGERRDTNE